MSDEHRYLIWSNKHLAWWRPNRAGYTTSHVTAGRYDRDEAISICALARDGWDGSGPPSEVPVLESDVLACIEKFAAAFAETS